MSKIIISIFFFLTDKQKVRDMELGIGMFGDLSFDFQNNKYQSAAERLKEIELL
ncbi:hypothetical protein MASR2M18_21050 [Ignavibacteria bacterium]